MTRAQSEREGRNLDWRLGQAICVSCGMSKTPKVVSIQKETNKAKMIAHDPEGHRIIIGIGRQRMALDFHTRITRLPPETGDQPAEVLPITETPKGSTA
jgi:hypothetical protein